MSLKGYLSSSQFAARVGVSGTQVRYYIRDGYVKAIQRPGKRGHYLIPEAEVERVLSSVPPRNK